MLDKYISKMKSGINKFKSNPKKYIPNILTTLRLAAVPFFWQQFLIGNYPLATTIFAGACITDAIDGNLARKWDVQSRYGKIVDPIADKTLVMSALLLYGIKINSFMFTTMGLEATIATINTYKFIKKANLNNLNSRKPKEVISYIMKNGKGDVSKIGKLKTVALMTEVSIALLFSALGVSKLTNLFTILTLTGVTTLLQTMTIAEYLENNNENESENSNGFVEVTESSDNKPTITKNNELKNKDKNITYTTTEMKEKLEKELEFLKNSDNNIQLSKKKNLKNDIR